MVFTFFNYFFLYLTDYVTYIKITESIYVFKQAKYHNIDIFLITSINTSSQQYLTF